MPGDHRYCPSPQRGWSVLRYPNSAYAPQACWSPISTASVRYRPPKNFRYQFFLHKVPHSAALPPAPLFGPDGPACAFEALLCIARAQRHRRIAPGGRSHCVKARCAPSLQSRPAAPAGRVPSFPGAGAPGPPASTSLRPLRSAALTLGPGSADWGHPVKKGVRPECRCFPSSMTA